MNEQMLEDFKKWARETQGCDDSDFRMVKGGIFYQGRTRMLWEAFQAGRDIAFAGVDASEKRSAMRLKELDLLFGRQLMVMRAAVIEMEHGDGHEAGMKWIFDGLFATGQFAPQDATNADEYFEEAMKPIEAGLAEVFAFFHPQYAGESETLKRPRNDACCGCVNAGHSGPCAVQEVRP